jgi:hypothetical protein
MTEKYIEVRTFMDGFDEKTFSESILKIYPGVIFIEENIPKNPNPPVIKSINEIVNPANGANRITILNTNIVSLESYLNVHIHEIDKSNSDSNTPCDAGIIRFLSSFLVNYEPGGLRNGELTAVIDPDFGIEAQQFVESIFSIFKNGSCKIYVLDPKTGVVDQDREENMFFAWPSAIKNYDQVNEKYLTHNDWCYFTSKINSHVPKLIETEHPITENEFHVFESRFVKKLPESFKNHYLRNNGGYISEEDKKAGKYGLSYFGEFNSIKFGYMPIECLVELYIDIFPANCSEVGVWEKYEFVPFANDHECEPIFMSLRDNDYGSIYMCYEGRDIISHIFPSFDVFIKKLYKIE